MKSYRIDRSEMLSHDNIKQSFLKPSRGKRNRQDVKRALDNLESEIEKVYNMLYKGTFKPVNHPIVLINEGTYLKQRQIVKPNYCYEQVVHHVAVNSIRPGVEHGLYEYVLGSIPKRGAHKGKKAIERFIRNDPENTKYVFKMDIRHFFGSVDHDVLKAWIRRKFRDEFIHEILFLIIDAVEEGLPLGYYTSQWLANFLLQPLDHFIKEKLHVKYMTRYMDDIVCFGRNKKELHRVHKEIEKYLDENFNLTIKGDWQVFRLEYETEEYAITCPRLAELYALKNDFDRNRIRHKLKEYKHKKRIFVKVSSVKAKQEAFDYFVKTHNAEVELLKMKHGRALDYMGFEFHRGYTVIRESILFRMTHKVDLVSKQEKINPKDAQSVLSYMGYVKHTNTYGMYEERIKPKVSIKKLKKVVSKDQKRRNKENERMAQSRGNSGNNAAGA